jgi:hypothetical protein
MAPPRPAAMRMRAGGGALEIGAIPRSQTQKKGRSGRDARSASPASDAQRSIHHTMPTAARPNSHPQPRAHRILTQGPHRPFGSFSIRRSDAVSTRRPPASRTSESSARTKPIARIVDDGSSRPGDVSRLAFPRERSQSPPMTVHSGRRWRAQRRGRHKRERSQSPRLKEARVDPGTTARPTCFQRERSQIRIGATLF